METTRPICRTCLSTDISILEDLFHTEIAEKLNAICFLKAG